MLQVKQNELYSLKRHKDNQLKFISGSLKKAMYKKDEHKDKITQHQHDDREYGHW